MKIKASTEIYGVIGNPVRHSLSPILHNAWIEECGFDAAYLAFEPKPEDFPLSLKGLAASGIKGLNITAPFKHEAARLATQKTQDVAIMAAANTLKIIGEEIHATNTDGNGLVLHLDEKFKIWRTQTNIVTILGVGGAASGILDALLKTGIKEIRFVGRQIDKCENILALATQLENTANVDIHYFLWEEIQHAIEDADLIINATTIGLKGNGSLVMDFTKTAKNALVYDMVYYPNETDFLKTAKLQNRNCLNGLGMLVGQAAFAFENWFGTRPNFAHGLKRLMEL